MSERPGPDYDPERSPPLGKLLPGAPRGSEEGLGASDQPRRRTKLAASVSGMAASCTENSKNCPAAIML
jgi:hypothetical protein